MEAEKATSSPLFPSHGKANDGYDKMQRRALKRGRVLLLVISFFQVASMDIIMTTLGDAGAIVSGKF